MTSLPQTSPRQPLSVFALVMINVIAVDSLKMLPFVAKFGLALVAYYLVIGLVFFVPVAMVTAELATAWPERGGVSVWVRAAFGPRAGFLVAWLLWVTNLVWFPTILGMVAGIISYIVAPTWSTRPLFVLGVTWLGFGLSTLGNYFGMQWSSRISTLGSIFGTLVPLGGIVLLGVIWFVQHPVPPRATHLQAWIPQLNSLHDVALVTTLMFGLMGLEMSAVHAGEVQDPARDYPRAILYSGLIIILSLSLSALAIAWVVPTEELLLLTGVLQAFDIFLQHFNLHAGLTAVAVLICVGVLSSVAAWTIGPIKALQVGAEGGFLPPALCQSVRGVPRRLLLLQAVIVALLSLCYVLLPSVETAYFILTELTALLALLMYLLMFAAAIKLRYRYPDRPRPYRIPGGILGMWGVAGMGGLSCVAAVGVGLLPPSQLTLHQISHYSAWLIFGTISLCVPACFMRFCRKS